MSLPERSAERDAAIEAALVHVPFDGWTMRALRYGLRDIGVPEGDAELLFPGGTSDMVETYCDLADRQMEQDAEAIGETRVSRRVRAVIAARLARNRLHKEAIRRGLSVMALPRNARMAASCTARTVDAVWHAAGDRSADFSWYTKRAILAGVYGATLLYWLRDTSEDDSATLAFLDRRLAGVGRIGGLRAKVTERIGRLKPA
jgi:ubiquinone biosynthesis protein COQ9